jgi:peptide/nickel transport system permease protein
MVRYACRRVAGGVLVVIGVSIATFVLLHLLPGNPARAVLGERATPVEVHALEQRWGLSDSLPRQFAHFVNLLVHGNLGQSLFYGSSISVLIKQRIAVTASLVGVAALFAVLISVPMAALAAVRRDRPIDHAIRTVPLLGLGMPSFWVGIVGIEIFSVSLHLLPVGGWGTSFGGHLKSLVLPGLTAALAITPILTRSLRSGMLDVLDADFVAAARSKGIGGTRVLFVHVVRNAAIPTITLLGINIAYLVGSTVVIEQVFALNGLGQLMLTAISNRDFPVVQGVTLVFAVAVVVVNLVTDLVVARLDPRVRLS